MEFIFSELRKKFPHKIIDKIEHEYREIKKSFNIEDISKIGIHSGRFCEATSSLICGAELKQIDDLNKINFNKNIETLINSPKSSANEEITRLMIPRILRSIYTIRSKKEIAHIKDFNPQKIDMKLINTSVDWILSQILLIYCNVQNIEVIKFLESISYEDYKNIERFENGEILFANKKITLSDKILFVLMDKYNHGRIQKDDIFEILKPKNRSYISTYVYNLKKQNLVHENQNGLKLTKWGIEKARLIIRNLNK